MTAQEFAKLIDCSEYPLELTSDQKRAAAESNLLIVYWQSDDLMEFDGVFTDEVGAYGVGKAHVNLKGVLPPHEDCGCEFCGYDSAASQCVTIEAKWNDSRPAEIIVPDGVSFASFKIVEDGSTYCIGAVIDASTLPALK